MVVYVHPKINDLLLQPGGQTNRKQKQPGVRAPNHLTQRQCLAYHENKKSQSRPVHTVGQPLHRPPNGVHMLASLKTQHIEIIEIISARFCPCPPPPPLPPAAPPVEAAALTKKRGVRAGLFLSHPLARDGVLHESLQTQQRRGRQKYSRERDGDVAI